MWKIINLVVRRTVPLFNSFRFDLLVLFARVVHELMKASWSVHLLATDFPDPARGGDSN